MKNLLISLSFAVISVSNLNAQTNYHSPLGIPLVLEINRQTINKSDVNEYFLEELENEILDEVGLN